MKTTLDNKKQNADILVEYANGGSYTIKIQNKNITLRGRGVKRLYDNGNIEVTESLLNKLRAVYNVECNF